MAMAAATARTMAIAMAMATAMATATAMAMAMATATAMAMAMAAAVAVAAAAVIRPEHVGRADLHESRLFIEKQCFSPILLILGPSRPQKRIRLEILSGIDPSGGL